MPTGDGVAEVVFGDEAIKTIVVTDTFIEVTGQNDGVILRAKSSEDSIKITIELSAGIRIGDSFIAKERPLLHVEGFGTSLLGRVMASLVAAYDR